MQSFEIFFLLMPRIHVFISKLETNHQLILRFPFAIIPCHTRIKFFHSLITVALCCFLTASSVFSQEVHEDSLTVKSGAQLLINDSLWIADHDTIIMISEGDDVISRDDEEVAFFEKLRKLANKNPLAKELYNLTFVPTKPKISLKTDLVDNQARFLPYSGMIIRNIRIRKLDIFGQTVYDTTVSNASRINKVINKVHVKTRDKILENNFFVAPGDTVNPWLLADNERHLRSMSYIENAAIYLKLVDDRYVDLVYVVKDNIPYGLLPVYHSAEKQSVKMWNANFLGFGRHLGLGVANDQNRDPSLYISEADLSVRNIQNSFIDNRLYYGRSAGEELYGFKTQRDILAGVIHLAGGISVQYRKYQLPEYYNDNQGNYIWSSYTEAKTWLGYQFQVKQAANRSKRPVYLTPAIGYNRMNYHMRPFVSIDSNRLMSNNSALFGSLTLTSQNFVQTAFLFDQGVEKDLPYGYSLTWVSGYTYNEFYQLPYFGIDYRFALSFQNAGYFSTQVAIGAHMNKRQAEQGVFKINLRYASPVFHMFSHPLRLIFSAQHTQAIRRSDQDSLVLKNSEGVPGLRTDILKGTIKTSGMVQAVMYLPGKWIGFSFTPYCFFNTGIIGSNDKKYFKNRPINGIGLGVRMRNEYLIFNSIQIRLVYYPYTPSNIPNWSFDLNDTDNLSDFQFSNWIPDYIEFK